MPPPRPNAPTPLTPRQLELIEDVANEQHILVQRFGDVRSRGPAARKELQSLLKTNPDHPLAGVLLKLLDSITGSMKPAEAAQKLAHKEYKAVDPKKGEYAKYKAAALKANHEFLRMAVVTEGFCNKMKSGAVKVRTMGVIAIDVFCERWTTNCENTARLVTKL